jgi:transcriptional regulator with XRE-family HTH domain
MKLNKREWLKDLRKGRNLTVRELAPLLEMSFSHYSDIENGRRNPSVELSYKMAKFFEVDVTLFFKDRIQFKKDAV